MSIDKKTLDAGYEYLKVAAKQWSANKPCAGMVWGPKGRVIKDASKGYICHAFLNTYTNDEVQLVASAQCKERRVGEIQDSYSKGQGEDEANIAFMTYLATENPLSKFIINRDDLSSIFEGGILIDAAAAGAVRVLWICKAFRYCNEERWRPVNWYKLVQRGVHPLLAMAAASVVGHGGAKAGYSHANVMNMPKDAADLARGLALEFPDEDKYGSYYASDTKSVFGWNSLGDFELKTKKVKVPDGWGGFVMKEEGDGWDGAAQQLIELTEKAMKLDKNVVPMQGKLRKAA